MTNFWDPALTQKRALINQQYGIGQADVNWQTKNITTQHGDAVRALTQQYAAQRRGLQSQRQALPGQYVGRGLLHSGIYRQGVQDWKHSMRDFTNQKHNAFGQLANQFAVQRHGLQSDNANQALSRDQGLNDVDLAEAQSRAAIAQQLKAVV